jgi:outer membrane protein assembly factor BamB
VYVWSWDNNFYAVDSATGQEKWRFGTGKAVESYAATTHRVAYTGSPGDDHTAQ